MNFFNWLQARTWNPVNAFDLSARYRNAAPDDQVRYAQTPPSLLRVQGNWRRQQYYRDLDQRLKLLDADGVGVEALLEARLNAVRGSAHGGLAGEMRAVRALISELNTMENTRSPRDGWRTRKRAREYVSGRLAPVIESAARRGEIEAALEGFRALEETGVMGSRLLRGYGDLLSRRGHATDEHAVRVYLQCLESHNWRTAGDPLLEHFRTTLSDALRIHETMPHQEIKQRLPLIARVEAGGGELSDSAKSLGVGYLMLGHPGKALFHLERACERDGHDRGETLYYFAQSLYLTEKFEQASRAFAEASGRGYPASRIAAWQGLSLAKSGQWDAAYKLFNQAEETLGPEADSTFYLFWARASYRMGAVEEASRRFRTSIEKSLGKSQRELVDGFDSARARHGLAICLYHEGETSQAIALLQEGCRLKEKFAPASHLLGRLLEQEGRVTEALPHYRAAVELNPSDMVFKLSLGMALDAEDNRSALPILLEVNAAGNGNPEILRRLAVGYRRIGELSKSREWFDRLAEVDVEDHEAVRWSARFTASEATAAYLAGEFGQSARLWERVAKLWSDQLVDTRLGQALLCAASARLKSDSERELDDVWAQIERAHQLAPCWESRYLNAVASLVHGNYAVSQAEFAALDNGVGAHSSLARLLEALARYLGGDEEALNELSEAALSGGTQSLSMLIALLQIQSAVRKGEFEPAMQRIEEWLQIPGFMVMARVNRGQMNALLWMCMSRSLRIRGVRQRTRLQKMLASLKQADEEFWSPVIMAGQVALELSNKKLGSVELERLEKCQSSLFAAFELLEEADRSWLRVEIEQFLMFRIQDSILRGNLVIAISLLDRLCQVTGTTTPEAGRLRALLEKRLQEPSHEKAFALLESDPDQARTIWIQRLETNPREHASIEHLATLAWTRAYDLGQKAARAVESASASSDSSQRKQTELEITRDFEAVISYFTEGLGYFRQLYTDNSYWEALRQKGRTIANARNPFSEPDFDAWRAAALQSQAQTLVNFASYVADLDKKNGVAWARSAMARLRGCGLPGEIVESLVDGFAQTHLGTDSTAVPNDQFDAMMARAERLLKIDEQNIQAMRFILRGYTYWAESSEKGDAGIFADRMAAVQNYAGKLEKHLGEISESKRLRLNGDLASYYETLGIKMNRKGNDLVSEWNAGPGDQYKFKRNLRGALEGSNEALRHAIRLDSTIGLHPSVVEAQKHNNSLLNQLNNM